MRLINILLYYHVCGLSRVCSTHDNRSIYTRRPIVSGRSAELTQVGIGTHRSSCTP